MTTLHRSPRREQTVLRDRLVDRLRARPAIKLTMLAVPKGRGRTTFRSVYQGGNDRVVLRSRLEGMSVVVRLPA